MKNITFVVNTYNEEKRISFVVKNFIHFGEVIVFDGGSTDKTKEIAESLGAKFLSRPSRDVPAETEENLEFLRKNINTDWIYWGYADVLAPRKLIEKVSKIAFQDKYKMVLAPFYTYLWGNTKNAASKIYQPMFFHKDFVDFSNNRIHSIGRFFGNKNQCLKLPNEKDLALLHFSSYDFSKFSNRYLHYAEKEAECKYKEGEKYSTIKLLAAMLRYCWIYRRSLRDGALGLIVILSHVFSRFMVYARLYEIEHNINLFEIEKKYSDAKKQFLNDSVD